MGGDRVTNGAGKASGLWGATMCGSSQLQLLVHTHLHTQGGALMYRPPYDHHGLCLQVDKMINFFFFKCLSQPLLKCMDGARIRQLTGAGSEHTPKDARSQNRQRGMVGSKPAG